jgi:transcriptional regulator GlxA family with amidase domain
MKQVEILVLEGSMLSSAAVTIDILQAANHLRRKEHRPPAFAIRLWGSAAAPLAASAALGESATAPPDLVVVPGLGAFDGRALQQRLRAADAIAAIKRLAGYGSADGVEIAASCSGVFLLGAAGLLDHRSATTAWWLAPLLVRLFPDVNVQNSPMIVSDGRITTAGAALAQVDLMLTLVARHAGTGLADACSRYLLMDVRQSQSAFISLEFLTAGDDRLRRMRSWAEARIGESYSTVELAKAAGMSPRTLARRLGEHTGLSPGQFLQRMRAEHATMLLETTRPPVEEIAARVGYADSSTLRRVLVRHVGRTPHAVRTAGRLALRRQL